MQKPWLEGTKTRKAENETSKQKFAPENFPKKNRRKPDLTRREFFPGISGRKVEKIRAEAMAGGHQNTQSRNRDLATEVRSRKFSGNNCHKNIFGANFGITRDSLREEARCKNGQHFLLQNSHKIHQTNPLCSIQSFVAENPPTQKPKKDRTLEKAGQSPAKRFTIGLKHVMPLGHRVPPNWCSIPEEHDSLYASRLQGMTGDRQDPDPPNLFQETCICPQVGHPLQPTSQHACKRERERERERERQKADGKRGKVGADPGRERRQKRKKQAGRPPDLRCRGPVLQAESTEAKKRTRASPKKGGGGRGKGRERESERRGKNHQNRRHPLFGTRKLRHETTKTHPRKTRPTQIESPIRQTLWKPIPNKNRTLKS